MTTTVYAISCKQIYDPLVRFLGSRTYNQVTIMSTLPAERVYPRIYPSDNLDVNIACGFVNEIAVQLLRTMHAGFQCNSFLS